MAAQVRGRFIQESEDSSCSRLESADVQLTPNRTFEPLVCEAPVPEQLLGYKDREGLGAEERGRDRMAPSSTVGHRSAPLMLFVLLSSWVNTTLLTRD